MKDNIMKLADVYAESLAELENENWVQGTVGSAGELGLALQNKQQARAALEAAVEQQAAEIANLQAKLSAMESVEPVGFISPHDLQMLSEGYPRTVVMLAGAKHTEALYTAPKVAQPLSEQVLWDLFYESAKTHGFTTHAQYTSFARAIEKAHNIGGQQP